MLRHSGAKHFYIQCKVSTCIRADDVGVFSLILQHVQQESLDAFVHTSTLMQICNKEPVVGISRSIQDDGACHASP